MVRGRKPLAIDLLSSSLTRDLPDAVSLSIATEIGAGIEPKSYPNAGAYGLTADVTRTPPKITSDYPGSETEFFDFKSFYFGCVAGAVTSVASAPVECELTVIGYNSSHEVARQTFTYSPGIALRADMMRADLSDEFRGINHATFESKHDVTGVLGATLLDDLNYTAYSFDEDYANDADDNDKPADTHSSSEQDKSENDANKRTVVQQDLSALYTRGISEEEKENGVNCKCKPVRPLSMYKKCSWRPNKYATEAQKNRECKCHYEGWNIECQVVPA